jgi:hypothetical protein
VRRRIIDTQIRKMGRRRTYTQLEVGDGKHRLLGTAMRERR